VNVAMLVIITQMAGYMLGNSSETQQKNKVPMKRTIDSLKFFIIKDLLVIAPRALLKIKG
jgi:hypothetical protein